MLALCCRKAAARTTLRQVSSIRCRPTQVAQYHYLATPFSLSLVELPNFTQTLNNIYKSFVSSFSWMNMSAVKEEQEAEAICPQEAVQEQDPELWDALTSPFMMAKIRGSYKPHFRKRKRAHGFLKRLSTAGGRKVMKRRTTKGRKTMAA